MDFVDITPEQARKLLEEAKHDVVETHEKFVKGLTDTAMQEIENDIHQAEVDEVEQELDNIYI